MRDPSLQLYRNRTNKLISPEHPLNVAVVEDPVHTGQSQRSTGNTYSDFFPRRLGPGVDLESSIQKLGEEVSQFRVAIFPIFHGTGDFGRRRRRWRLG